MVRIHRVFLIHFPRDGHLGDLPNPWPSKLCTRGTLCGFPFVLCDVSGTDIQEWSCWISNFLKRGQMAFQRPGPCSPNGGSVWTRGGHPLQVDAAPQTCRLARGILRDLEGDLLPPGTASPRPWAWLVLVQWLAFGMPLVSQPTALVLSSAFLRMARNCIPFSLHPWCHLPFYVSPFWGVESGFRVSCFHLHILNFGRFVHLFMSLLAICIEFTGGFPLLIRRSLLYITGNNHFLF